MTLSELQQRCTNALAVRVYLTGFACNALCEDGLAAGTAYWLFALRGGPHAGQSVWCMQITETEVVYDVNDESDGYTFNTGEPDNDGEHMGGAYLPEYRGLVNEIEEWRE